MSPPFPAKLACSRRSLRRRMPPGLSVSVTLMVVLLVLLTVTLDLSGEARRLPLATIVILLTLLILDSIRMVSAQGRTPPPPSEGVAADPQMDDDLPAPARDAVGTSTPVAEPSHELVALVWLGAAGIGIYTVGYIVTVPIFLVAFFVSHRVSPKVWIPVTAAVSALMYFGFDRYLGL